MKGHLCGAKAIRLKTCCWGNGSHGVLKQAPCEMAVFAMMREEEALFQAAWTRRKGDSCKNARGKGLVLRQLEAGAWGLLAVC